MKFMNFFGEFHEFHDLLPMRWVVSTLPFTSDHWNSWKLPKLQKLQLCGPQDPPTMVWRIVCVIHHNRTVMKAYLCTVVCGSPQFMKFKYVMNFITRPISCFKCRNSWFSTKLSWLSNHSWTCCYRFFLAPLISRQFISLSLFCFFSLISCMWVWHVFSTRHSVRRFLLNSLMLVSLHDIAVQ